MTLIKVILMYTNNVNHRIFVFSLLKYVNISGLVIYELTIYIYIYTYIYWTIYIQPTYIYKIFFNV